MEKEDLYERALKHEDLFRATIRDVITRRKGLVGKLNPEEDLMSIASKSTHNKSSLVGFAITDFSVSEGKLVFGFEDYLDPTHGEAISFGYKINSDGSVSFEEEISKEIISVCYG